MNLTKLSLNMFLFYFLILFYICFLFELYYFATEKIIQLFTENPRKILGQKSNPIAVGAVADLTLFDPAKEWIFGENDIYSK